MMTSSESFTYGSVFSGVGGFDLGLDASGMKCKWQIEIDRACQRVLERHWPSVKRYGDITTVWGEELEPVDLICGGSPCTDVSVAGRRAGLAGEKSRLFFEFTRLIAELAPSWFVFENTPGLFSSQRGLDFSAVLGHFTGYFPEVPEGGWHNAGICNGPAYNIAWCVLDSQYFGVPQRRRRIFVVGHLGNRHPAEVLFDTESVSGNPPPCRTSGQEVASTLGGGSGSRGFPDDTDRMTFIPEVSHSLNTRGAERQDHTMDTFLPIGFCAQAGGNNSSASAYVRDGSPTLTANEPMAIAFAQNQRGEITLNDSVGALSAGGGIPGQGYSALVNGIAVRRMTPLERERCQGWPDNWTAGESDAARYRMTGNGVTAPVAEWIAKRVLDVETSERITKDQ